VYGEWWHVRVILRRTSRHRRAKLLSASHALRRQHQTRRMSNVCDVGKIRASIFTRSRHPPYEPHSDVALFATSREKLNLSGIYHNITLAGLFWKRDLPQQPEPAPSSHSPHRRIMSRTPEQPRLTPQFCFNQTALRGKLLRGA
jgi:hypothetical protein